MAIPGEVVGVAQAVGEDLDARVIALGIEAPELGRERILPGLVVVRRVARLTAIGARAAADVEEPIGALGEVVDAVVIGADPEVVACPEPRAGQGPALAHGAVRQIVTSLKTGCLVLLP